MKRPDQTLRREGRPAGRLSFSPSSSKVPSVEQLEEWMAEGGCEATDGCWVEPDGVCEHGKKSWLLVLGMV